MSDLLNAALDYAKRGLKVFPVHGIVDGVCTCGDPECPESQRGKHPVLSRGFLVASTQERQVREWWTKYPNANIGARTGRVGGFLVIDEDEPGACDGMFPDGAEIVCEAITRTGRKGGGHHYWFRVNGEAIQSRSPVSADHPGVDVKSDGGYVILPPSRHVSGREYAWHVEPDGDSILDALTDAPESVREAISGKAPEPRPKPDPAVPVAVESHGAAYGMAALRAECDAVASTPEGGRNARLNAAAFRAGQLLAAGDVSEAQAMDALSRAADACGLSKDEPSKTADVIERGVRDGYAKPRTVSVASGQLRPDFVPFPVNRLPDVLREYVTHEARAINVDPAMIAPLVLGNAAGMIGNARSIRLREDYHQACVLWVAVVAPSGSRKSPAVNSARCGVIRVQADAWNAYEKARAAWKKGDPEPVLTRPMIDDATVPAVVVALNDNPRGLIMPLDELDAWFGSFNAHTEGHGGDVPKWLQMHGAGAIQLDRKTGDLRVAFVRRAAVSLTGSIPPSVLREAVSGRHLENGLAPRFLFSQPPSLPTRWVEIPTPLRVRSAFVDLFRDLREKVHMEPGPRGDPEPVVLGMKRDAAALYAAFHDECGAMLDAEDDEFMRAALSKMLAHVPRIALVLGVVRDVADGRAGKRAISFTEMEAAVDIGWWFVSEARRAAFTMTSDEASDRAQKVLDWLQRKPDATVRDIQNSGPSSLRRDTAGIESALQLLEGMGRVARTDSHDAAGRTVTRWRVRGS